jgi:hypothetical protein
MARDGSVRTRITGSEHLQAASYVVILRAVEDRTRPGHGRDGGEAGAAGTAQDALQPT